MQGFLFKKESFVRKKTTVLICFLFEKSLGHRGVSHVLYKLILLYRVFTTVYIAFYGFKNSNYFLRYDRIMSGCIIGSSWEGLRITQDRLQTQTNSDLKNKLRLLSFF